ncbi:MAG: ferritin-like domain-containing protein [Chloroflexi bacterium]|nr:ferritin-like domain-containing protein [Chloroflexota bacterium]
MESALDRNQLAELMNEDLGTEYRSIVQYNQHLATLKGLEVQSLLGELKQHLGQELNHAMILAEQIDFLGGVPTVHVPPIPSITETKAALRLDLELEEQQLERYRERIQQAQDLGLPDVAEALRPLLEQTQEHVRDLRTALGH